MDLIPNSAELMLLRTAKATGADIQPALVTLHAAGYRYSQLKRRLVKVGFTEGEADTALVAASVSVEVPVTIVAPATVVEVLGS